MSIHQETIDNLLKKPTIIEDLLCEPKYKTNKLSINALRNELRKKRDIWEIITRRSQDIEDEVIASGSAKDIKARLDWYESDEAYVVLAPWLIKVTKRLLLDQKKISK